MKLQTGGMRWTLGGAAVLAVALMAGSMMTALPAQAAPSDLWIHVRVDNPDNRGDMVRVNFPVALAEVIVSSVNHDQLRHGHINIGDADLNGVDLRSIMDALKTAKDGEFISVKHGDQTVRVAKQGGILIIHVNDPNRGKAQDVEIHVPMTVVDALVTSGGNDLDIAAALHALAAHGTDTELVSVKDGRQTIRIWLDSKSTMD